MEPNNITKGNRNKIYFLIVVIAALIGTNAYLFFKDKNQNERFVNISTEKDKLKLEVEKIEVELDKVNALNLQLNEKLTTEQELARKTIEELKASLEQGEIKQAQLDAARKKIEALKTFIKVYNEDVIKLEEENKILKTSKDSLEASVKTTKERAENLSSQNAALNEKVKTAAALKIQEVRVTAFRTKSNGKKVDVTKYSSAENLSVLFTIVPNEIAEKGNKNIYLRVFDPAGNLLADEKNRFEANGQEMQFSHSIYID